MDVRKRIEQIKQEKSILEFKINSAIESFESKAKIKVKSIDVEFVVRLEDIDKALANEQKDECLEVIEYKKMGLNFEGFETKQKRKK